MSSQADALAQVYARSLFQLAEEAGGRDKIAEVGQELEQVCELARGDRAFREFLASPVIDQARRSTSLRTMFNGRVTDLTLRFLLVLNDKGRLGHLEAINTAYDQLVQEEFGRVEVDVFTPAPLGGEAMSMIASRIQSTLGREPVLHQYSDPTMLGGIRLRIGDQLIDGSVSSRLRRLRQELLTAGGLAIRDATSRIIRDEEETAD